MRTIPLLEYKHRVEKLTREEVQDLDSLPRGFVDVSRRADGDYSLRAGSRVGTAVTGSLRVLVRPKVGLRNVFFLLGYANNIRWGDDHFPYAEDDLLRAVAWWFDRAVARAARFGLARAYVEREETLTTIRGRIGVDRQLAVRPGRRYPIECRYEEYSEDTPLNRLLKAAHLVLLRVPQLDRGVASALRHRTRHFLGGVTSVDYSPATMPRLTFTHLNRQWESAARIAELIVRQQSIRDQEGAVLGTTFTIDMNRLFERFIETVVREQVWDTPFILEQQARRSLTSPGHSPSGVHVPAITMRPDLLILHGAKPVAVGDAKYKELLRIGDWEHPDLYQLLAYCVRLGLRDGVLIYARKRPLTESAVLGTDLSLSTIGVDLTGPPGEILSDARRAANALIGRASTATAQVA